jgi:hypothetical protein
MKAEGEASGWKQNIYPEYLKATDSIDSAQCLAQNTQVNNGEPFSKPQTMIL